MNGPLTRTRSENPAKSIEMPLRAFGWNVKSSVSLRKSSVPDADTPSLLVSIAIERSTLATPLASGSRTTAHTSSVDGSRVRNGLIASLSLSHTDVRSASFELTSVGGPAHEEHVAGRGARPGMRRVAAHREVDRHVGLAAADFPRMARGGRGARQATGPCRRDATVSAVASACAASMTMLPASVPPNSAAEKSGTWRRPASSAQTHAQVVVLSAAGERELADRELALRVDPSQRREAHRRIRKQVRRVRPWARRRRGHGGRNGQARSARAPAPRGRTRASGRAPPVSTAKVPVSALVAQRELQVVERVARAFGLDLGGKRGLLARRSCRRDRSDRASAWPASDSNEPTVPSSATGTSAATPRNSTATFDDSARGFSESFSMLTLETGALGPSGRSRSRR